MDLSLTSYRLGDTTVVTAEGRVDAHTAMNLRTYLTHALSNGRRHVILDLNRLQDLNPVAVGVIVGALRRARERGGSLQLACANTGTRNLLHLSGIDRIIPVLHERIPPLTDPSPEPRPPAPTRRGRKD